MGKRAKMRRFDERSPSQSLALHYNRSGGRSEPALSAEQLLMLVISPASPLDENDARLFHNYCVNPRRPNRIGKHSTDYRSSYSHPRTNLITHARNLDVSP